MKRIFAVTVLLILTISSYAQFTTYKPVIVPQRSSSTIPDISFPDDPLDEIMRYNAAQAKAMEIVSSDIINADGFNLISETYSKLKVKVVRRRNGQVNLYCMGIKKNNVWSTCDKEIASLEEMYQKATKESDKTTILGLMEYGNYLLMNTDTEIYVIK